MRRLRTRSAAFALTGASFIAFVGPLSTEVHAQATVERNFDIPAQDMAIALEAFGRQSGKEILFDRRDVAGKRSKRVSGRLAPADALRKLVSGSGLSISPANADTFLVRTRGRAYQGGRSGTDASIREDDAAGAATEIERAEIVVTGTRIRGAASPSPVVTITDKRIREEGFTRLGDVIRSIPQNFGGGQNPGIAAGSGSNNQNITGGSALNLRGLGVDATLTLLNGRRLSYGGFAQAVDLSIIPVAAVSRIEILTDGASALYGTDAVAGVANVILNRDFEGVNAATRYGFATDGGGNERQFSLTGGKKWDSGGFIAAYDFRDADEIRGDQRSYTGYLPDPSFLYPAQRHHSGLVSFHQDITPSLTFTIDGLYTDRLTVGQSARDAEETRSVTRSEIYAISPTLKFTLPGDWTATIGGSYSSDEAKSTSITRANAGALISEDDFRYTNASSSIEANLEGSVIALPGGDVRLAVGAGYRKNDFDVGTSDPFNTILNVKGKQNSRYAFGEVLVPLFSPEQGVSGLHRLSITGALRYENYRGIGDITTPKVGLIWSPTADATLKGSWGRAFKAPTLFQQFQQPTVALYPAFIFGPIFPPTATVLYAIGGNTDLQPERAKTWSTTLSVHPRAVPGLKLEATYFSVDYRDRVVNPVANLGTVFSDTIYADYVTLTPSAGQVADTVALSPTLLNVTGAPLDPTQVAAIIDSRLVNAARERVRGIDVSGSYSFGLAGGEATLRGSASWLHGRQRLIDGQEQRRTVGNIYNPSGFRGRGGAVWSRKGATLSAFVNHVDGVIDINQVPQAETGSFTTVDLAARYRTDPGGSLFSDVEISLSITNLFDQEPPLYPPRDPVLVPYDSTNVSAIGRFISIGISKHW